MDAMNSVSLIENSLGKTLDFNKYEDEVMKPLLYLRKKPNKLKNLFVEGLKHWFDVPKEKQKIVEEIHLLLSEVPFVLDDIIDDSKIAQKPHIVYGIPATLICCEYANAKLLEKIVQLNSPEALRHYIDFQLTNNYGQAVDVYFRENYICPSLDDYIKLIHAKATSGLQIVSQIMQDCSQNKKDYSEIIQLCGVYWIFLNDYRNLFRAEKENKNDIFADDLTEGKFTFPLIHSVHILKNLEVREIVNQRPKDLATKRRCVKILEEIGTKKYCDDVLGHLGKKLKEKIREVGGNLVLERVVDEAFNAHK